MLFLMFGNAPAIAEVEVLKPTPAPPSGKRMLVFISDLHLGLGHTKKDATSGDWTKGAWHPMEDFRWHMDFDAFLTDLEGRSKSAGFAIDLVLVGDFLELWQSPWLERDCMYDASGKPVGADAANTANVQKDLSCTEVDALSRTIRVLGAHRDTLLRLKQFAENGDNRVTIVPGNHDAALVFNNVAKATFDAIGASADRVRIAKEGYWHSADGLVLAEHGHFIEGDVNSYDGLPASCLTSAVQGTPCDDTTSRVFLRRPWGEQFVQLYYNEYEERFPIIDNLTSEAYGVKLAVREAGTIATLDAIRNGFRFLLFNQSSSQWSSALGPDSGETLGQPGAKDEWDIAAVRERGDSWLVESLDNDDPIREGAQFAIAQAALGLTMDQLANDELRELCDRRAARYRADVLKGVHASEDQLCPGRLSLGALKASLLQTASQRKSRRLEAVREGLPQSARPAREFAVYVYGHTHAARGGCRVREMVAKAAKKSSPQWNPVAVNTGAWQRLITPAELKHLQAANPTKPFSEYVPEDLPECYSMVIIPPYQDKADAIPQASVWFWAKDLESGQWGLRKSCAADPTRLPEDPCAQ
ncbi:MAG: hypothetical protein K2Y35_11685 [Burkholderiales bacterium]|nr:hypothetical protein [Burkholderiales bacterium]